MNDQLIYTTFQMPLQCSKITLMQAKSSVKCVLRYSLSEPTNISSLEDSYFPHIPRVKTNLHDFIINVSQIQDTV